MIPRLPRFLPLQWGAALCLVLLCLNIPTPTQAALPPEAIQKNESASPEILTLQILNIQTYDNERGEQWQEADALILETTKTTDQLKPKDQIKIRYRLLNNLAPLKLGGNLDFEELLPKDTLTAFLSPLRHKPFYHPTPGTRGLVPYSHEETTTAIKPSPNE